MHNNQYQKSWKWISTNRKWISILFYLGVCENWLVNTNHVQLRTLYDVRRILYDVRVYCTPRVRRTYQHSNIHIHTHNNTHIHRHTHTYYACVLHICIHMHHMLTPTYTYVCAHTHTLTYIRIHIKNVPNIHIHTRIQ